MAKPKALDFSKAQEQMGKGNWKKALVELDKLYAEDSGDPLVSLRKGDVYVKLGETEKAVSSYMLTAQIFGSQGHVPKAVATYKMVLRIAPDHEGVLEKMDELTGAAPKPALTAKSKPVEEAPDLPMDLPDDPAIASVPEHKPASGSHYGVDVPADLMDILGGGESEQSLPEAAPQSFDEPSSVDTGYELPMDEDTPASSGDFSFEQHIASPAAGELNLDGPDFEELPDEEETGRYELNDEESSAQDAGVRDTVPVKEEVAVKVESPAVNEDDDIENALDALDETPDVADTGGPKTIPLLYELSSDEMWDLLSRMKKLNFKAGQTIVKEGENGDSMFIIRTGSVRVVTRIKGREIVLARLEARDFFGEVSFLTGRPRTADIVADVDCEIMELGRAELDNLIEKHPRVEGVLKMFHESRVADTVNSLKAVAMEFFK